MRGSGDYDRKKKDTVVCLTGCAVVFFFVVAGNFDYDRKKKRYAITTGKKNLSAGNFHYDRKKKSSSRQSGGYAINYDRRKKDTGGIVLVQLE